MDNNFYIGNRIKLVLVIIHPITHNRGYPNRKLTVHRGVKSINREESLCR